MFEMNQDFIIYLTKVDTAATSISILLFKNNIFVDYF